MKHWLGAVMLPVLILQPLLTLAAHPQTPRGQMPDLGRPTQESDKVPPLDFDSYFLGTWEFEWFVPESPLGSAGELTGTTTYTALGGMAYQAETKATGPDGPFTRSERIEYNAEERSMSRVVTDSRGFSYRQTASVSGDLGGLYYINFESEPFRVGGQTVQVRDAVRLLSPLNYRVSTTVSVDGGPFRNYGTPWWRKANPGAR